MKTRRGLLIVNASLRQRLARAAFLPQTKIKIAWESSASGTSRQRFKN
jgi:hypothetical protein